MHRRLVENLYVCFNIQFMGLYLGVILNKGDLFCLFTVFFGLSSLVWGQEERGRPFSRYYPPKEYKAATQNWCMTQAESGLLYFGNNKGLLEYDGAYWRLHGISNGATIRSVAIEPKSQHIYVGGQSEFGVFAPNKKGVLTYQNISDLVEDKTLTFNDVWGTIATPQGVYFSSVEAFFYWNDQRVKVWKASADKPFDRRAFRVHDRIFINQQGVGLQELRGWNFAPIEELEWLKDRNLAFILPASGKRLLIGTRQGEVFFWDERKPRGQRKEAFLPQWNSYFKQAALYRGTITSEGMYVLSTITSGVMVVDEQGLRPQVLKEEFNISGAVYYAEMDQAGDLWICLDKGLIKAEYSSALSRWDEETGLLGSVIGVVRHQGRIYAHTGKSLFALDKNNRFSRVGNESVQTWDALSFVYQEGMPPALWFVDNSGLYALKDGKPQRVAGVKNNVNHLIQDQEQKNIVYVTSQDGILVIKYEGDTWRQRKIIPIPSLTRNIQQGSDGSLWIGTYNSGYIHVQDPLADQPVVKTYFDEKYQIPLELLHECFVWRLDQDMVFVNEAGVFRWNGTTFKPDSRFDDYFKFTTSRHVLWVGRDEQYIWVSGNNSRQTPVARAKILPDGRWEWELVTDLQRLPESLENFLTLEPDGKVWVSNSEGVFLYNPQRTKTVADLKPLLIREVRAGDSLVYVGNGLAKVGEVRLPYPNNSLIFYYSLPFFEGEQSGLFQYQLEGVDEGWSGWVTENKREYVNLWEGTYTFKVRAQNTFGQVSEAAVFSFRILPPWYRSWWAYLLYAVVFGLSVSGFVRLNTERVLRRNRILEEIVAERTHQIQEQAGQLRAQKEEMEKAYDNIKILSDIGQQITAELNIDQLIKRVYENVNNLMEAEAFGIGVLNRERQQLEFRGFIERGEELPFSADRLSDKDSLAVICFKSKKEILINDLDEEISQYLSKNDLKVRAGQRPFSLIYLPLIVEDSCLGVLTVQSFKKDTYADRDITFLRTLGSYVSIALANARMYGNIQSENRKTVDSLRYAQTIQNAILPPTQDLTRIGSDHLVIFRPRDIVSGDFYWALETDGYWFLAVVDCTGHGVPGAFMSMIGHSLLNEIINERHVLDPVHILEELNRELRIALRQEDGANEDGMDLSLCRLERLIVTDEVELVFSGVGQSMFYHDGQDLHLVKGERTAIGGRQRTHRPYKQQTIALKHGDVFYLYSDGIIDQNGPEDGSKFGTKRLQQLLSEVAHLPMNEQFARINQTLNQYQKEMEQRDDITFLGIRV